MVILGGLELVVGGYLVHRHYKHKNEKKRIEQEASERRHHTFPGPKPQSYTLPPPQQQQQQQQPVPQFKYTYQAEPREHHQPLPLPLPLHQYPIQQSMPYLQTCPQPQNQPYFNPQIRPLQRHESIRTLSDMPVANGSRPSDLPPALPLRPQHSNTLPVPPQNSVGYPYGNAGFSVSTPSFQQQPASPILPGHNHLMGRNTIDDNWEVYGSHSPHVHIAVSGPQPSEEVNDPPPPYRP